MIAWKLLAARAAGMVPAADALADPRTGRGTRSTPDGPSIEERKANPEYMACIRDDKAFGVCDSWLV